MLRRCPSCGKRLKFFDVLRPAFGDRDACVVCSSCDAIISKPFRNYIWIPILIGLPLGLVIDDMAELLGFGCNGVLCEIGMFAVVLSVFVAMLYAFIPLQKVN